MATPRAAHLVGSIPAPDAAAAMRLALAELGDHLLLLPDGETGERFHWVVHSIEGLREHPDLERRREGDWSDYDKTPTFKVARGRKLGGARLDFGHVAAARESFPVFQHAREQADGARGLSFLVGIPGDFDMAVLALRPSRGIRHRAAFREAMIRTVRELHAFAGDDAVFQIEVPLELVTLTRMPGLVQPLAARLLARGIVRLAGGSPAGARFGVHLCLGDMNHRALGHMTDSRPLVRLANALARRWPEGRPLEYLHLPFAAAREPPSPDASFYRPLSDLRVDPSTRIVAGFAHEEQDLDAQLRVRELIEQHAGRRVDVSASCGLGRREAAAAQSCMRRTAELVAD